MSRSIYVAVSAPCGGNEVENGIDLVPGQVRYYRGEHWDWLRANSQPIDDACFAAQLAIERVTLGPNMQERCDIAWRRICRPWSFSSSTRDGETVRDPDEGMTSLIGAAR